MTVLEVRDLEVRYGHVAAVDHVSIRVPAGRITALTGPNGAGKTSLQLGITGAIAARGAVLLGDRDVSRLSATRRARAGIAIVPEGRQIFPRLTVRDNLNVVADALSLPAERVEQALDRFPILRERQRGLAGLLSGGEQQMLAISRALMTRPGVLLLDEMAAGLAPRIIQDLVREIRRLADEGLAVLMAEPQIAHARGFVDAGYVLLRGRVVSEADSGDRLDRVYRQWIAAEVRAAAGPPTAAAAQTDPAA